jgi:hypothetical protein|tara:strand:+ start:1034 stop:1795 length:762 start_codon:yes stop_codon:yes gene_type:complete
MTENKEFQYNIPENSIVITPTVNTDMHWDMIPDIIEDMRGKVKRDWFVDHAYFCLPLTIANQYGYGIRSLSTFEVIWNGGNAPQDLEVNMIDEDASDIQQISSHFGMGLITIQNNIVVHTPKFVNMMTMNPTNMFIDGLYNMNGVVETDNLKRDFTFNVKVTRPNHTIRVNKGDIISGMMPIQRYFVDSFHVKNGKDVMDSEYLEHINQINIDFGIERGEVDINKPHGNGRRYFNGEDVYGCPFHDHQRKIKK